MDETIPQALSVAYVAADGRRHVPLFFGLLKSLEICRSGNLDPSIKNGFRHLHSNAHEFDLEKLIDAVFGALTPEAGIL